MKRRDFFNNLKSDDQMLGNLDEFTTPLDITNALHLLRRITFHPTPEMLAMIVGNTAAEAFEIIVGTGSEALPDATTSMKSWLDTLEEDPLDNLPQDIRGEIEGRHKAHFAEFASWWLNNMKSETFPAIEKFTLFLHSIWCVEFTYDTIALIPPPLLYRNNNTLRKNRLGDYRTIAKSVSLDGAMIMYQSLFYSSKGAPNENYMRELMELFTMGIGDLSTGASNYTEGDIREGARALTGWRTVAYLGQNGAPANRPFETFFVKSAHDTEAKKLMQNGQINAITDDDNTEDLVKTKEVHGVVDILFSERGMSISRYICEKMLRFFVYSDPGSTNMSIVNELAQYMNDNSFELRKVFKKLFTSQYFFSDTVKGAQIKTPPELVIGLERMLGLDFDSTGLETTRDAVFSLEQILYDPPNVGSWKAYRTWISTTTFPLRAKYAKDLISKLTDDQIMAYISKFSAYANSLSKLNDALLIYMLPVAVTKTRSDRFLLVLQNGLTESEWIAGIATKNAKVIEGIRAFLTAVVLSPDFQLC